MTRKSLKERAEAIEESLREKTKQIEERYNAIIEEHPYLDIEEWIWDDTISFVSGDEEGRRVNKEYNGEWSEEFTHKKSIPSNVFTRKRKYRE